MKPITMPYWKYVWWSITCFFIGVINGHRLAPHKYLLISLGLIVLIGLLFSFYGNSRKIMHKE